MMGKMLHSPAPARIRIVRLGFVLTLLASLLVFAAASAGSETWWALGEGSNDAVYALTLDSTGSLVAGGSFTNAGGISASRIARWDGSAWTALGSGLNAEVYALAADGSGNVYAGGSFTSAGGVAANRVARWNGTAWSALGSGMDAEVYALVIDDNGVVYAGGTFTSAGGHPANRIARWDGSAWSEVGGGTSGRVNALIFDPLGNLYVGGTFTSPANRIARWDGSAWAGLGSGLSNTVRALALDGAGNLFAGGSFASAGGGSASRIARWDGAAWSALGSGLNADVYALGNFGGKLVAAGNFSTAGGLTAAHIARWDGSAWAALGSGTDDAVRALAADGNGNIYAGGDFTTAGGLAANHLAGWGIYQPGPLPSPTSLPPNSIAPAADSLLFCTDESTTVTIYLTDVNALFGYQFSVHYDSSLAEASAAFVNTFFDTETSALVPPGWDASCASGACRFAAALLDPALPVSGSGPVAQVILHGKSPGSFDLSIGDDILTDRDSRPLQHDSHSLRLSVCGYASVSGVVSLQGRETPMDAGQVTLNDLGGFFGPYTAAFDPVTGAFSLDHVKVLSGGSNYQFEAAHGLYLGNRMTQSLHVLEAFTASPTHLLAGDANNDGLIDIGDLTCIGGSFGSTPVVCGTDGSSDINADGLVNILDLVLPGGNYGLTSPGDW